MKAILLFSSIAFLLLIACNQPPEPKNASLFSPGVTEARGYVVPKDSMAEPKVVLAGKPKAIKAGRPEVVLTNTNVVPAGVPKIVKAGTPKTCTPGQDGFSVPRTVTAIVNPFLAGIPQLWPVKDTYFKDNFPKRNSSFIKLRGMSLASINCIMKDKNGNIWIGAEGSATRFNGKFTAGFTKKQGLVSNAVACMLQDRHGNIWFGCAGGVSRFDGKFMTNFTQKEGFGSKSVLCILEDKSGNIWFGTRDGSIIKYDGNSFMYFTEKHRLGEKAVFSMALDKNGNIWFGTNKGLYCYDGNYFKHFTMAEGLSNDCVKRVITDREGNLWLALGGGGISCFDGKSFINFTLKEGIGGDGILDMTMDHFGNLWIATDAGGLCRFDGKTFTLFTTKKDLADNRATVVYCDNTGNIWVGGGRTDGLMRYNDACFMHYTTDEGLSETEILSLLKDKKGRIWIGTSHGGVNLYDGKSFTHFARKEGLSNAPVTEIIQADNGNIWFATSGDGAICYDGVSFVHFTEKEGLAGNYLEAMVQDKEGNIWMGTEDAGLSRYDGKSFTQFTINKRLRHDIYLSAYQDNNGILWFGTAFGGVVSYDGKRFTQYAEKEGFCNNMVYQIYQDKSNYLWFCTIGKGAVRYDGKSFVYFTEKEGIKNNNANGMLQDKSGNLCFASGSGLSILRGNYMKTTAQKSGDDQAGQAVLFRNFSPEDGFSGWGCNGPICEGDDGTVWIASSDRLTAYFPARDKPDTTAPVIQLTGVQLYNENVPWLALEKKRDTVLVLGNGIKVRNFKFDSTSKWYSYPENLSLAYNNNYVTFTFIGVTPKLSTKVTYRYKLEGMDENWSTFSSLIRTEAPYGNIPPGTYIFKVKAMNAEGYWSKEFNYTFTIRPPWWKTWWAYTGYVLLVIAAIGAAIYTLLENQRRKIRLIINERNRIARELHDDIGAELSRISVLSQLLLKKTNMDQDILEKLRKISETGKKVLGSIGEIIWTMNPQKDNLDSLAAYIRRFVTEYLETNGIDINIEFPDEIPANAISDEYRRNVFLVIKEAISNITKYSKATSVRLSLNIREKLAEFEISDNGTGFSVKEKENWGNGLSNMNQRMKDIGGTFLIRSEINEGTFIKLTFPVR